VAGVDANAILVPQRAVSRNPLGQAVAMFVDKDGKIEQRTLDLGEDVDGNWLVLSGAKAGDRLVVEGTQKARPGAAVKTVEVAVDPATGLTVNPTRQADARPAPATAEQ
jgi:membrane fusion protein (multidrug efflux system)